MGTESDKRENTPEFLITFGDDEVTTAMNEHELQDTLKDLMPRHGSATIYKVDGDAVWKNGKVNYYPLGFSG